METLSHNSKKRRGKSGEMKEGERKESWNLHFQIGFQNVLYGGPQAGSSLSPRKGECLSLVEGGGGQAKAEELPG